MLSDAELIKGCLEGKNDIQKLLYKKYASTMFGICLRYFEAREEAEDALQEGFIKVFTNLDSFRSEGSLEGWIKRIMVNTALNLLRNHQKYLLHTDIEEVEHLIKDESDFLDKFSEEELLKLLQELPHGYRLVFNLYEIEGYSHKEIAEMLEISVSTSKTQLLKARKVLQRKLIELNREMYISPYKNMDEHYGN
jgi:RNA polymerase sigma factor (sigma-70 family)